MRQLLTSLNFRDHRPNVGTGIEEGLVQLLQRPGEHRRPVDQGNECRIAPMIQDLLQADQQGTELSLLGMPVDDQKRPVRIGYGRERRRIVAGNDNHQVGMSLKQIDGSAEKRVGDRRPFSNRRPGEQGLVAAHASGKAGRQDHAADTW